MLAARSIGWSGSGGLFGFAAGCARCWRRPWWRVSSLRRCAQLDHDHADHDRGASSPTTTASSTMPSATNDEHDDDGLDHGQLDHVARDGAERHRGASTPTTTLLVFCRLVGAGCSDLTFADLVSPPYSSEAGTASTPRGVCGIEEGDRP